MALPCRGEKRPDVIAGRTVRGRGAWQPTAWAPPPLQAGGRGAGGGAAGWAQCRELQSLPSQFKPAVEENRGLTMHLQAARAARAAQLSWRPRLPGSSSSSWRSSSSSTCGRRTQTWHAASVATSTRVVLMPLLQKHQFVYSLATQLASHSCQGFLAIHDGHFSLQVTVSVRLCNAANSSTAPLTAPLLRVPSMHTAGRGAAHFSPGR